MCNAYRNGIILRSWGHTRRSFVRLEMVHLHARFAALPTRQIFVDKMVARPPSLRYLPLQTPYFVSRFILLILLYQLENNGPYLSLVVVTHHDTNPGLFNTKFRLNFGRAGVQAAVAQALSEEELNTIVIGRSSSCAMVLDYRTVSTTHAKITYTVRRNCWFSTLINVNETCSLLVSCLLRTYFNLFREAASIS